MCASGSGPSQIARILKKEQILTPTMYAYTRYGMTHTGLDTAAPVSLVWRMPLRICWKTKSIWATPST